MSPKILRLARLDLVTISRLELVSWLMSTDGMLLMPERFGVSDQIPLDPTSSLIKPRPFNTSTKSRTPLSPVSNGQPEKVLSLKSLCDQLDSTFWMLLFMLML